MRILLLLFVSLQWLLAMAQAQSLPFPGPGNATGTPPPVYVSGAFTAVDGSSAAVNTSTIAVTVSGSNTLLLMFAHSEFGDPEGLFATFNSVPGTNFFETDGYTGGTGNHRFTGWYWVAPTAGTHDAVITYTDSSRVPLTGSNELAVTVILYSGAAQILYPFRDTQKDISAANRTSETETVTSSTSDAVVHVVASSLTIPGTPGAGETTRLVATDGVKNDASLLLTTKAGASSVTVSSSGWANTFPLEGIAMSILPAGTTEPLTIYRDALARSNESPLSNSGAWTQPAGSTVNPVNLVSNLAKGGTANENIAIVATPSFAADQRAQIVYQSGQFTRVWVRVTNSGGYMFTTNSASDLEIYKVANSGSALTYTRLGSNFAPYYNLITGDLLELQVSGTTLTAYINGLLAATRTDATYATGQPGLGSFGAINISSAFLATSLPARN